MEKDVREIKYRVGGIEKGVDLLLRANRKQIVEDLMGFFGRSTVRVKVFLAVDGERSVGEIVQLLAMKQPNVSATLTELEAEGLILIKAAGSSKVFMKTQKVEILKLDRELKKKFGDLASAPPTSEPAGEGNTDQEPGRDQVSD